MAATNVTPANLAAAASARRAEKVAREGHLRRAQLAAQEGNTLLARQLRELARA